MKTIVVKGKIRENLGKKSSKKIRNEEHIPCVLYGGKENVHFSIFNNDFRHLIYTPNVYIVNIELNGNKYNTILKDVQFHPVTDNVIHADFLEIFEDKSITISVPIKLSGNSIGIKDGGKLRQKRRTLLVKALPKNLPDELDIDITDLDIGRTLKVGELNFENLEILDPNQSMVISIVSPRVVAKGMEEAIEEEEVVEVDEEVEDGEEGAPEGAPEGATEETAEAKAKEPSKA